MDYNYLFGGVKISSLSGADVNKRIAQNLLQQKSFYCCVANLRTTVAAQSDVAYKGVVNNAFLNIPDGMPLVWAGKLAGKSSIERITGAKLMQMMLSDTTSGYRHFFFGDTSETLNALVDAVRTRFKNSVIAGSYSPPFKKFDDADYADFVEKIQESGANVVWVSLGAPRQDFFSEKMVSLTGATAFIGVGAAFRSIIGQYPDPPVFFQKIGLTGLFWRFKDHPLQSTIWYFKHFFLLGYYMIKILVRRYIFIERSNGGSNV